MRSWLAADRTHDGTTRACQANRTKWEQALASCSLAASGASGLAGRWHGSPSDSLISQDEGDRVARGVAAAAAAAAELSVSSSSALVTIAEPRWLLQPAARLGYYGRAPKWP